MKLLVCCLKIKNEEMVLMGLPGGTCSSERYQPAEHHPEPELRKILWEASGQLIPCSSNICKSTASSARSPALQSPLPLQPNTLLSTRAAAC